MSHEHQEALVIMNKTSTEELRSRVTITQTFPNRIYVVEAKENVLRQLHQLPEVICVLEKNAPPPPLPPLNEGENVFVLAWLSQSKTKVRKGEGLAWDDPHFKPPA